MGSKLLHWIKRVRETEETEITCSECLDQVSRYVDLELATGDAAQRMPQLKHHLDQCLVCREEYTVLRDLARLEEEGDLPTNDALFNALKRRAK